MAEIRNIERSATPASFVLGRKLDSIPFSGYHILIIVVLALVGFIGGYDLGHDRIVAGAGQSATAPN